ncbi:MAG: DUF3147 family protein [Candidatus Acidiferrales bacterium]
MEVPRFARRCWTANRMACYCAHYLERFTPMMPVRMNISAVFQTRWYEYAVRFFFGGLITVAAGLIAKRFGPMVGGLFLAFPAIFPASATLVDKHENERNAQAGLHGSVRGRLAASLEARGAAMGSIGLIVFALIVWKVLRLGSASVVLSAAVVAWFAVSISLWYSRRVLRS